MRFIGWNSGGGRIVRRLPACLGLAADHGDAPYASVKRSGDLNDLYVFLDPNDNSRVVVILTAAGFTVPSEAVNFSVFDDELVFEFQFDTNFDAVPDQKIKVRFSRKRTSGANPQTATITLPNGRQFTGADHVVQPRGRPACAHDHPRSAGYRFLRRLGRRPLLLRHPGLQPLRRLGARGSPGSGATSARPGQLRGLQHPGDRVFLPGELLR